MHKYVPITMPVVESFTISSSKTENKTTSSVLFNVVGNKEDVKPLSYIYPFGYIYSFGPKRLKELLKNISDVFVEMKSSPSIQITEVTFFFKICSLA